MVSCICCGVSHRARKAGVSFHRIPKNAEQRKVWLAFANRDESSLPRTCFVCSQHFIEDDFDRTSQFKVALKNNAVPTQVILRAKYDRSTTKPVVYIGNIGLHNFLDTEKAENETLFSKQTFDCSDENHLNTNEDKNENTFPERTPSCSQENHLPDTKEIKIETLFWEEHPGWSQEKHLPNTIKVKNETPFSEQTPDCSRQEKHLPNTIEIKNETPCSEQAPGCLVEIHYPSTNKGENEALAYKQTPSCSQEQQSEERIVDTESVLETPREKRMKFELDQLSIKYLQKVDQVRRLQKSNWAQKKRLLNLRKVIKELLKSKNVVYEDDNNEAL